MATADLCVIDPCPPWRYRPREGGKVYDFLLRGDAHLPAGWFRRDDAPELRMTTDGMEKARRLIAEEREKKTGFLDLGYLGLTEVPTEVFELTHLRSLNLGSRYIDEDGQYRDSVNEHSNNALPALPEGLHALGKLVALSLSGNQVSDLSPLAKLTALQSLDCSATAVSDLNPLAKLTTLQSLDCSATAVSGLSPLAKLTGLQSLDCSATAVSDLSPLAKLTTLQSLDCSHTQVSDLGPLQALTALQSLDFSHTQVSDLSPLKLLTASRI